MFRIYEFYFFLFFVLFRRIDLCIGWLVIFSMSWMLNNEMYLFFLIFLNWFLTFKNQERLFVTVFLTLCQYLYYRKYHSSFVLAPTFIFGMLIFRVVKNEWFQLFFLDFRHFFGLQTFSINIRQYWEFDSKLFLKFPVMTNYYSFLPASVLIKTIFCLWIFCCLSFLWSILFLI